MKETGDKGIENLDEEIIDLDEVLNDAGYQPSEFRHHSSSVESESNGSRHHSSSGSGHHSSGSGHHHSSGHHSGSSGHHSSEHHHSSSSSHHSSSNHHSSSSGSHHSSGDSSSGHGRDGAELNSGLSESKYVRSKRLEKYAKKKKGSRLPGLIITVILAAIVILFDFSLVSSKMLPDKYVVPVIVGLIVIIALVLFLTLNTAKTARFVFGAIIAAIAAAVLLYATVALGKVTSTIESVATTETEVSYVGVYVLMEDTAQTLEDVQDDTFGIMEEVDRGVTNAALEQINEELGMEVATAEYAGPSILVGALYGQDCRCIVLNEAYIDVVAELDGYEDVEDKIRELARFEVEEEVTATDGKTSEEEKTAGDVFTVYISGVDSRSGLTARSRSDVNILATINKDTHQILLVSTPRDYYVPLSISNGQKDKLTHAGIYGVQVSMDTLGMLYGVDVDYYFRVSFEGFEDIVDALGGVSVYSDYDFTTNGYSFHVGYNDVDGAAALAFARERHAFADGDRQRGRNQMALISAIIDEAISPAILTNYTSVLNAAEENMEMSIPYDVIAQLVSDQLDTGGSWEVISYSVTGSDSSAVPWSLSTSAYVMEPDESTVETASELMQAMINGERISSPE